MATKVKKELTLDEKLDKLDEINDALAEEDIDLQEAINLYKEGILLVKSCEESLSGAEKELETINAEEE